MPDPVLRAPAAPAYLTSVPVHGSTSHAKGPWLTLVESLPFTARWMLVQLAPALPASGNPTAVLVDVATGPAGDEGVLLEDLWQAQAEFSGHRYTSAFNMPFPVTIPEGSRVAVRAQGVVGLSARCALVFGQGTFGLPAALGFVTYGAVHIGRAGVAGENPGLPTTSLTLVNPGTVPNTKGAWAVLTTASAPLAGFALRVGFVTNLAGGVADRLIDVGTSPDGVTWTVVVPDVYHRQRNDGGVFHAYPGSWWFPVAIPGGMHIGIRGQSTATAGDRHWGVELIGVAPPLPPPPLIQRLGRRVQTADHWFEYDAESNQVDFGGGGARHLTFLVQTIRTDGRLSPVKRIAVSNPAPDMSSVLPTLTVLAGGTSLRIDWASWLPEDADFRSYQVRYGIGDPPIFTAVVTVQAAQRWAILTGLASGEVYGVQVVPYDEFGAGVGSAVATVTVL